MPHQVYIILGLIAVIALFAFGLSRSIKSHEAKMAHARRKKGRSKYMQQYKKPGK